MPHPALFQPYFLGHRSPRDQTTSCGSNIVMHWSKRGQFRRAFNDTDHDRDHRVRLSLLKLCSRCRPSIRRLRHCRPRAEKEGCKSSEKGRRTLKGSGLSTFTLFCPNLSNFPSTSFFPCSWVLESKVVEHAPPPVGRASSNLKLDGFPDPSGSQIDVISGQ